MNHHQDLTWAIHALDIHMTSAQGALEGVVHVDGVMILLHVMVLRWRGLTKGLIRFLPSSVQEVSRVILKEFMKIGILAGEDPQMSPHKEGALKSHLVRSVDLLSLIIKCFIPFTCLIHEFLTKFVTKDYRYLKLFLFLKKKEKKFLCVCCFGFLTLTNSHCRLILEEVQ